MTQKIEELGEEILPRPGKDEMNFAEFPIALLTDRVPKGQKSIKFEDEIYDERRNKTIKRRRIIEGSEEFGLPTATDDAVILALIQLSKQQSNLTARELEFTRLELIKMLGWSNEGKNYERIKLSLLRIANVTYNYVNAWWDPRQKAWTTRAFHIIDSVEINDSRAASGQSGLFASRIVWGDAVYESFQAGFLRNIDFQLCMRLEHPTALRMYRFLGKRFHVRPEWEFDLKEFAYEQIGLGRNYEGGTQIARKLQPAIDELEKAGFLEPLGPDERFGKTGRDWTVRFVQKRLCELPPPICEVPMPPEIPALATELMSRGVSKKTALELVCGEASTITHQIEVFDWLVKSKDKKVAKSPAGYLVKSINDNYATPKGFVSKAEQQRRQETKQTSEESAAHEQLRKRQAMDQSKADQDAADAYWNQLTKQEQEKLDAAAEAQADPGVFKLETGAVKKLAKVVRRREYIQQLLATQKR